MTNHGHRALEGDKTDAFEDENWAGFYEREGSATFSRKFPGKVTILDTFGMGINVIDPFLDRTTTCSARDGLGLDNYF